jgi:hypothetical protein
MKNVKSFVKVHILSRNFADICEYRLSNYYSQKNHKMRKSKFDFPFAQKFSQEFCKTRNYFRLTSSEGQQQSLEVLLRILRNLATPQLRNVATMGGTVMWGHAASDILPLLRHRVFHVYFLLLFLSVRSIFLT